MVASNHCQYPIPEAMIPKVKERCGEWVEKSMGGSPSSRREERLEFPLFWL